MRDLAAIDDQATLFTKYQAAIEEDRQEEADTPDAQAAAYKKKNKRWMSDDDSAKLWKNYLKKRDGESVEAYSQRVAPAFCLFQKALSYFPIVENRRLEWPLTLTVIAITRYHLRNGTYPASLKDLIPTYLTPLPRAAFPQGELRYQRDDDGYQLRWVGDDWNAK